MWKSPFFDIVETLHIVVGVNRYIVPLYYMEQIIKV